jgi:hypothetical protein
LRRSAEAVFKTAVAAIDGVGSILLRSLKDKSVLRKQVVS